MPRSVILVIIEISDSVKHDSGAMEDQDSIFSMEDSTSSLDMDSDDFAGGGGGGGMGGGGNGGGSSSMSASIAAHLKRGGGSGGGIFDQISQFKAARESGNSSPTMMERKISTVKTI